MDLECLRASLRLSGQLNPLVVLGLPETGGILVSGFRRLQALRDIGLDSALAWFLAPAEISLAGAFQTALFENLSHRGLSPLEKARSLRLLQTVCSVGQDEIVASFLPRLGLPAHKNVLRSYLALDELSPELKRQFLEGRLTLATAERLSRYSREDRRAMQEFFEQARWSASLQRQLLNVVEELAAAGGCTFAAVIAGTGGGQILDDAALSGFQKGEKIYELLYRRRNPRLSAAEARFQEEKQKLGLPGSVRLMPEPYFETPRLRVEFDVISADEFRQAAEQLSRAAESPSLPSLFCVS